MFILTITSRPNSLNTRETTTYYIENQCPGLVQAQKRCGFKPVNETPTLPSL